LQRGATVDEMVAEMVATREVERLAARCDMDAFVWDLKQLGWL
jgi:hypothetical protein